MKRIVLLSVLFAGLSLTGCFSRQIVAVEEHPKTPALLITTTDDLNIWIYRKITSQFWECNDNGKQVVCKKACGGDTDLTCPAIVGNTNNFSSAGQR